MESTFERISRKTGRKPISCKCYDCKKQCQVTVGIGTPEEIEALVDAGHGDKIIPTLWGAGKTMGVTQHEVPMFQIRFDTEARRCSFFTAEGLCGLHELGLKPTECRLSHHSIRIDNFRAPRSISWNVAKEWMKPEGIAAIERIKTKLTHADESAKD